MFLSEFKIRSYKTSAAPEVRSQTEQPEVDQSPVCPCRTHSQSGYFTSAAQEQVEPVRDLTVERLHLLSSQDLCIQELSAQNLEMKALFIFISSQEMFRTAECLDHI